MDIKKTERGLLPVLKVAEVAEELGVTRQTVYNWIDRLGKNIDSHIYKRDWATVIDKAGIELIRQAMEGKNEGYAIWENDENKPQQSGDAAVNDLLREHIDTLRKELERKDQQLEEKDRQLAKKDELLEQNNDLLRNFQVIVRQSQERVLELEGEVRGQKKTFWQRLKWWE